MNWRVPNEGMQINSLSNAFSTGSHDAPFRTLALACLFAEHLTGWTANSVRALAAAVVIVQALGGVAACWLATGTAAQWNGDGKNADIAGRHCIHLCLCLSADDKVRRPEAEAARVVDVGAGVGLDALGARGDVLALLALTRQVVKVAADAKANLHPAAIDPLEDEHAPLAPYRPQRKAGRDLAAGKVVARTLEDRRPVELIWDRVDHPAWAVLAKKPRGKWGVNDTSPCCVHADFA